MPDSDDLPDAPTTPLGMVQWALSLANGDADEAIQYVLIALSANDELRGEVLRTILRRFTYDEAQDALWAVHTSAGVVKHPDGNPVATIASPTEEKPRRGRPAKPPLPVCPTIAPIDRAQQDDGLQRLATSNAAALLRMRLPTGVVLADADRDKLHKAAQRYDAAAAEQSAYARWLRLIAIDLVDGKCVRQVFTNHDLERLLAQAKRARR